MGSYLVSQNLLSDANFCFCFLLFLFSFSFSFFFLSFFLSFSFFFHFNYLLNFQYYAHRDKMTLIDREKDFEIMNRNALKMARQVANDTGTLMAGNICNSNIFHPDDPTCRDRIMAMFKVRALATTIYLNISPILPN